MNSEIVGSGAFQELKDWQPYHMLHEDGRDLAILYSGEDDLYAVQEIRVGVGFWIHVREK
jgi:hypothetical protein